MKRSLGAAAAVFAAAALLPAGAGAATIPVTTTADEKPVDLDNGACSLREAVNATNFNTDVDSCDHDGGTNADTITLGGTTYTLNGTLNEDSNGGGDLDVEAGLGGLTIDGLGQSSTTVSSGVADRVLDLRSGSGGLNLSDLTVTGGNVTGDGGGVQAGTNPLTLTAVTLNLNVASGAGGGLRAGGATTIQGGSVVSNNDANGTFGGGGVYTLGTLQISGSTITGNDATNTGPSASGGGVAANFFTTVTGSVISNNSVATTASSGGGGIYRGGGNLTITNSQITGNHADSSFGGGIDFSSSTVPANPALAISGTTISGNTAEEGGTGVRVGNTAATVDIVSSGVIGNTSTQTGTGATNGGGILTLADTTTILASTIADNQLTATTAAPSLRGGGIAAGNAGGPVATKLNVINSTVSGNRVGPNGSGSSGAGGIDFAANTSGLLRVQNSTVSDNVVETSAAGAGAGGILAAGGPASLVHATVAGNSAATAPAVRATNAVVTSRDSILAGGPAGCTEVSGGDFNSADGNVDQGTSCLDNAPGPLDRANTDPQLLSLADNGGPTQTRALAPTSPALDLVPNAAPHCTSDGAAPIGTDQRGLPRPSGAACDAGAYELQRPAPAGPGGTTQGATGVCRGKRVTIVGTSRPDDLRGTPRADVIAALGGADDVAALGGNDVVCGGGGADDLNGGGGKDNLLGQGGKDDLAGGGGKDGLVGGGGRDECNGGGGTDTDRGCEAERKLP